MSKDPHRTTLGPSSSFCCPWHRLPSSLQNRQKINGRDPKIPRDDGAPPPSESTWLFNCKIMRSETWRKLPSGKRPLLFLYYFRIFLLYFNTWSQESFPNHPTRNEWAILALSFQLSVFAHQEVLPNTLWASNPTVGHIPRGNQNWKRHMYASVLCSAVYNS